MLTIVDRISPAGRAAFTVREKEVPELLIAGRSNKEIWSPLGIGERTVKAHVAKLMRKVGVDRLKSTCLVRSLLGKTTADRTLATDEGI